MGEVIVQLIRDKDKAALSPDKSAMLMLNTSAQYHTSVTCSAYNSTVSSCTPAEKRRKNTPKEAAQVQQSTTANATPYLFSLFDSVILELAVESEVEKQREFGNIVLMKGERGLW